MALSYFWLITYRLNPIHVLHPFLYINSSQCEIRVTEIKDCKRGQTFTNDHIHGGLGHRALSGILMFHKNTL